MAYPKPLSEKSIARMYTDSKLSEEKIIFLRKFFDSCASLYGSICLNDMWEVYKELSKNRTREISECIKANAFEVELEEIRSSRS